MFQVKLSEVERLLLVNQYEILSLLSRDDPHRMREYELKAHILKRGYDLDYPALFERFGYEVPRQDAEFLEEVLSIYDRIGAAIYENEGDIPEDIRRRAEFAGFSDSSSISLNAYARFTIQELKRHSAIRLAPEHVSGKPKAWYLALVSRWRAVNDKDAWNLSCKTIQDLLAD